MIVIYGIFANKMTLRDYVKHSPEEPFCKQKSHIFCLLNITMHLDIPNTISYLACIARDYLAIPASSVASEYAFSSSRNMITNKRSSLAPKTVRAAQCLKS